jgi:hypothetical protein
MVPRTKFDNALIDDPTVLQSCVRQILIVDRVGSFYFAVRLTRQMLGAGLTDLTGDEPGSAKGVLSDIRHYDEPLTPTREHFHSRVSADQGRGHHDGWCPFCHVFLRLER